MSQLFACTYISKEVEKDDFEHGCLGERTCVLAEPLNITAESFAELMAKVGARYGLAIDDLFIPDEGDIGHVDFNRLEDADGSEPTARQRAAWKQRKEDLFLADYSFAVEKRIVSPMSSDDILLSGIKTH